MTSGTGWSTWRTATEERLGGLVLDLDVQAGHRGTHQADLELRRLAGLLDHHVFAVIDRYLEAAAELRLERTGDEVRGVVLGGALGDLGAYVDRGTVQRRDA